MTEADEKRLAEIDAALRPGPWWNGTGEAPYGWAVSTGGDFTSTISEEEATLIAELRNLLPSILRLLDERTAEVKRLERSVTKAEAKLQRLSFAAGNVALDHPDWPPEYARHLAALVARAEAAERRVAELEEVLRGFEGIGFKPCKDPACYRATLTMMQQAHTALTHTDEASDDRPRADQERYGGGF